MVNERSERYNVSLPVFEGPLDLLLQLIEREKLDITAVSLAQVTDQFLVYVRQMEEVQPGTLADFLVVAARLVFIKSRVLLPQPAPPGEEDEEDPAEALARQLREYKRFRDAARALQALEVTGQHSYVRVAAPPEIERRLAPGGVPLTDFLAAVRAAFAELPPDVPVDTVVPRFTITIHDQIELIARVTAEQKAVTFRSLLGRARRRVEIVVTLLAVLELLKRRQLEVEQDGLFGEIIIRRAEGVEITDSGNSES